MIVTKLQQNMLNQIFNIIPQNIINDIEFFSNLDNEYKNQEINNLYENMLFSPKIFKNKELWHGFWLRATGIDKNLYVNWLCGAVNNQYGKEGIIPHFKEAFPKEKYIPYSIAKADEVFKEIKGF